MISMVSIWEQNSTGKNGINKFIRPLLVIALIGSQSRLVYADGKKQGRNFVSSAFVTPASPNHNVIVSLPKRVVEKTLHDDKVNPNCFVTNSGDGFVMINRSCQMSSSQLLAKKKKKSPNEGKGGKIQVKLLKYVEGTGSVGDVVMVAPAFFEHKLKKTKSAVRVSDEEVAQEQAENAAQRQAELAQATDLQEKINEVELSIPKKVGPDGTLFGGVNKKTLLTHLKNLYPKGTLDAKYIKITSIKGSDEKELKGDIKVIGSYTAIITLLKDISAKFKVTVVEE